MRYSTGPMLMACLPSGPGVRGAPQRQVSQERREGPSPPEDDSRGKHHPCGGRINIDINDPVPVWEPYRQPMAPEGAPSVLYVVLDEVGFGDGAIRRPDRPPIDCRVARPSLIQLRPETFSAHHL